MSVCTRIECLVPVTRTNLCLSVVPAWCSKAELTVNLQVGFLFATTLSVLWLCLLQKLLFQVRKIYLKGIIKERVLQVNF